ncbi:hypothetical protein EXN66_Car014448 [Channa argus]|uniref:Uncharacterized protein n=1 Tax=Channa argus TaxID=215402 RepID=A0A6G1Q809_CHAAH|nr:hypothetical protein EXN66_Car014448 [Channa argus]
MDTQAVLVGVAMAAGDMGAHASPQASHLTHPVGEYGTWALSHTRLGASSGCVAN